MLKVNTLSFAYGNKNILDQLNFDAAIGELVCILGANGSGKTTLLSCIAGYLDKYEGDVTLNERSLKTMGHLERAKQISYMPQHSDYQMPYRVYEMILMGRTPHLKTTASPKTSDIDMVKLVLDKLGIGSLYNAYYARISGGEQQLVRLARGIVQEASLQLLDEPMASLDVKNEMLILEYIVKIMADEKKCVVMTTHNPNHVFYFKEKGINVKVILMADGKIIGMGMPESVMTPQMIKRIYGVHAEVVTYENQLNTGKSQFIVPMFIHKGEA